LGQIDAMIEKSQQKTLNGRDLHVRVKDGHMRIEGAEVKSHALPSSNGVIHSLDTVVLMN
jgi:uncharacterized surface protein with fasciclin (FAS1) repeats